MKIVQINATCGIGSTGKICVAISRLLSEQNIENYILHSGQTNGYELGIGCANNRYLKIQALKSRVFGNYGFNSKRATRKMIRMLERIKPDIVHLHNLHGHDCDLEILACYFKKKGIKVVWTFHDCWAFTGYCPYFTMVGCDRWTSGCGACVQCNEYSWFFDRSRQMLAQKKRALCGLDLTIVTPSQWLKELVKQSFLKDYPVRVINNGIDLSVFKPTESSFRQTYDIPNEKKIVLGVAFDWGLRKGLDVFIELANKLDENYQLVLVGTDAQIDAQLPENIIAIHRTQNQEELAQIYTAADVFVNPTREENFPTVNIEALACGTPVVTFNTGGSPEMLDSTCGSVVACDDMDALQTEIARVCTTEIYTNAACVFRASLYNKNNTFKEYIGMYEEVVYE